MQNATRHRKGNQTNDKTQWKYSLRNLIVSLLDKIIIWLEAEFWYKYYKNNEFSLVNYFEASEYQISSFCWVKIYRHLPKMKLLICFVFLAFFAHVNTNLLILTEFGEFQTNALNFLLECSVEYLWSGCDRRQYCGLDVEICRPNDVLSNGWKRFPRHTSQGHIWHHKASG